MSAETPDDPAARLLGALAYVRERMIDLAVRLRRRADVTGVRDGLDVREFLGAGLNLAGWVDAELVDERAICFWLETRHEEERWVVEGRILEQTALGQETNVDLGNREAGSLDQLAEALRVACDELVALEESFPFAPE
ncbi:MAG TPA: hypothetical protein VF746_32060 [Longimicrobium sp.]|jgi:hypothetical protein